MVLAFHVHILVIPQMCPLFLFFSFKSFYQNVKDCVQLLVAENPINSDLTKQQFYLFWVRILGQADGLTGGCTVLSGTPAPSLSAQPS